MSFWLNKILKKEEPKRSNDSDSCILRIKDGKSFPANIEGIFEDQACFIIASGPSFKDVNKELFKTPGIITMGLNNSPKSFRPNLWVSMDGPRRFLQSIWEDPTIMKFCGTGKWKEPIWDYKAWEEAGFPASNDFRHTKKVQECPNVYYIRRNTEFNHQTFLTESSINWGSNKNLGGGRSVLMAAIKLCYVLGFRRVYLNGVDFRMSGDYTYHFEEKRHNGAVRCNTDTYRKMISYFTRLLPHFKEHGYNVYNCTKGSDLSIIPFVPLEDAIKNETSHFPDPATEQTVNMYIPNR